MRIFQKLSLLLIFALPLCFSPIAQAQIDALGDDPLVRVRILPESTNVEGGDEIWLGIEQIIKPEWHTYWKNPGDSGSEPRINWQLPDGFSVSDIHWPTPEKLPYGPLLNYGYSDKVVLLQKLKVPASIGDYPYTLRADFEVLVCKEECIPEFSTHEITLNAGEGLEEDNAPYIAVAQNKLPQKKTWDAQFSEENGALVLSVDTEGTKLNDIELFPLDWGLVDNIADAQSSMDNGQLVIRQARSDRALSELDQSGFVIATEEDGVREGYSITAQRMAPAPLIPEIGQIDDMTLLNALLFALLGGIVLNLMPCVFPVLSMKAVSLVKISEKHPERARAHGLSYTAGVVISFLIIAGILLSFKAAGYSAGWGFQLQNPIVISLLAYILFLVGLNLAGYFDINSHFGGLGQKLTQGDGLKNSFFTGVLATLVATPCTAPFMAAAIGFALTQNAFVSLIIFAALGLGLALPYLVLSFAPALQKKLPKPGPWMEHFKHLLAFPMFGATIWLVWVLSQQAGSMGVLGVLIGMLGLAFGIWLLKVKPEKGKSGIALKIMAILALLSPLAFLPVDRSDAPKISIQEDIGMVYTPAMLSEALAGDDPVFVEMTAAWCITCKVNHSTSINVPSTLKLFKTYNVEYLIGDWTNYDPKITNFLNSYGRDGVPIYVYYGPRDSETGERPKAEILPQILTPGIIRDTIENSV